jgi:hypothetical protein
MEPTLGFVLEKRDWIALGASAVSLLSIFMSLYVYRRVRSITLYSDLDRLYLELLKLGIENPKFVDPNYTQRYPTSFETRKERTQYELYAFIAWNICETIVDRGDNHLTFQSWKPVLALEANLHSAWFESEGNEKKFKKAFIDYIARHHKAIKEGQLAKLHRDSHFDRLRHWLASANNKHV